MRAALLSLVVSILLAAPVRAEPVLVFAAASLEGTLAPLVAIWGERTGNDARLVSGGSGALAKQIEAGAPAAVFVSAAPEWMDRLQDVGRIDPASRTDLLTNRLALVAHDPLPPVGIDPSLDLPALLGGGRLAVGLVGSVPAGTYARAALESLGLWDGVAGRLAETDNVRAALALVESGAAPLGIVYATDAAGSGVATLGLFPEDSHSRIVYPAALVDGAPDAAAELLAFLQGPEARAAFDAAGFGQP